MLPDDDLTYAKGLGPQRAQLLSRELGLRTAFDLSRHFPSNYMDRSQVWRIADFQGEMPRVLVRGRFIAFSTHGEGAKTRYVGLLTDGSGTIEVVWFKQITKIRQMYVTGREYTVFGKPDLFNGRWSMVHPEVEESGEGRAESVEGTEKIHEDVSLLSALDSGLSPGLAARGIYPLTEKLYQRGVSSRILSLAIKNLLERVRFPETLPQDVLAMNGLMEVNQALRCIHFPTDGKSLEAARLRFKFEELFYAQIGILRYAAARQGATRGMKFDKIGRWFNTFYRDFLPFPLTGAQKRVLHEIRADMNTGAQMNRLLQGDVGSGKTLVALMTMLIALDNDAQAVIMAPTEILAQQHHQTLTQMVGAMGVNVRLLTGSTPKRERDTVARELASGQLHILVGTHALLEDWVEFRNLGVAVIDEQHRFGVAQRARLWAKNSTAPHVLVMTATPIPRTLAMTVYGDLKVSVIDELPPGRKPIKTILTYGEKRFQTYQAIGRELNKGRQAYIVYPLVKENEKLDLLSLQEGYDDVCEAFHGVEVAFVHGQMKPREKDAQMERFVSGKARILVATTVIEVGVNVPNATVMLIENAERFGLSQLHQLRGRVGRGGDQSYCLLSTKYQIGKDTRQRLELMTQTTDGFVIAEADMRMRGPGDISGTQQSGVPLDFKIANLATDGRIVAMARRAAEGVLGADPALAAVEHAIIPRRLAALRRATDWGKIS